MDYNISTNETKPVDMLSAQNKTKLSKINFQVPQEYEPVNR